MPFSVHGYRDLLSYPGVARLIAAACLSRLTTSMVSLSLLLAIIQRGGGYAEAGAALTAHAFALAVMAPVNGRVADRIGPRTTMLGYVGLHACAYVGLLLALVSGASTAVVLGCTVIVGASTPPAAPVTRAQWPVLVSGARLHTAYAVDSVLNASMLVTGPLVAGALMLAMPAVAVVAVAGSAKIAGDLALATAPMLWTRTRDNAGAQAVTRMLGPIGDARLCLLLVVMALDTFTYGCLQIGAAAIAGGDGATALLFSALAAGEIVGGLIYGARAWPGGPKVHFAGAHLVTNVLLVATGQFLLVPAAVGLYALIGLVGGVRDVLGQLTVGALAKPAHRAEAFAWLATAMWGGYGVGTLVAGHAQAALGPGRVFLAAALASLMAVGVAVLVRWPSAQTAPWTDGEADR